MTSYGSNAICIDNNVIINYLCNDEANEAVDKLFDRVFDEGQLIYVPALLNFEFAHVLARKKKTGYLTDEQGRFALKTFFQLPIVLTWKEEFLEIAYTLVENGLPSLYDASYLAVAMIKNIPLVTFDKELYKRARMQYDAVFTPEQLV